MKMLFGYNFGKLSIAMVEDRAEKEDWNEIDPESLSTASRVAYDAYRVQRKKAGELKAEFERIMRREAGIVSGEKTQKASKSAISLSDFLAMNSRSGYRA